MSAITPEERAAIRDLQELAKRWPQTLTLFSWSGSLVVFHAADMGHISRDGHNAEDLILETIFGIPNDGGDP